MNFKKRLYTILLSVVMIFSMAQPIFATGEDAQIIVSTVDAAPGGFAVVEFSLANNPGITSFLIDVTYDKALTLTKIEDTALLAGSWINTEYLSANPYTFSWGDDIATTNNTKNGTFLKLTFKVSETATDGSKLPITIRPVESEEIFNVDGDDVAFTIVNGGVNVKSEPTMSYKNLVEGDTTTFTLDLTAPDTISGSVIVATYAENVLKEATVYDAAATRSISVDAKSMELIKVMWWESFTTFKPVTEAIEIDLTK